MPSEENKAIAHRFVKGVQSQHSLDVVKSSDQKCYPPRKKVSRVRATTSREKFAFEQLKAAGKKAIGLIREV